MAKPYPSLPTTLERLEAREQPAANLLADLNTAGMPAFSSMLQNFGADLGTKAAFTAADGTSLGLFASDGTAAGTVRIAEVPTGETNPALMPFAARGLAKAGNRALYWTATQTDGTRIWTTDGTTAGTTTLKTVGDKTMSLTVGLQSTGSRVVFGRQTNPVAPNYLTQTILYGTDGTDSGTQTLGTFESAPTDFIATGGKLHFLTTRYNADSNYRSEVTIWSTDGTSAGTKPFAVLPLDTLVRNWGYADWATFANGKLHFTATNQAIGEEPWESDGTPAGTKPVADLNPKTETPYFGIPGGIPTGPTFGVGSGAQGYTAIGGTVYFVADDGTNGQELWSRNSSGTTLKLTNFTTPQSVSRHFTPALRDLTAHNGRLYFQVQETNKPAQVYVVSAVGATPVKLTSFATGADVAEAVDLLGGIGSRFHFQVGENFLDRTLYETDGTAAGTKRVLFDGKSLKNAAAIAQTGGTLLFAADDGVNGQQLYATDGTATRLVTRLNPNNIGSNPVQFTAAGSRGYFTATDTGGGNALYTTDGKAAPMLVMKADDAVFRKPTWLSNAGGASFAQLTASNGKLFAVVAVGPVGAQLVRIDGTTATTLKTIDPPTGSPGSYGVAVTIGLSNLVDAAGTLYFTLDLPGAGQQLWKSDGTVAGTTLVKTILAKSYLETPTAMFNDPVPALPIRHIEAVGAKVYFTAGTRTDGNQLWV